MILVKNTGMNIENASERTKYTELFNTYMPSMQTHPRQSIIALKKTSHTSQQEWGNIGLKTAKQNMATECKLTGGLPNYAATIGKHTSTQNKSVEA